MFYWAYSCIQYSIQYRVKLYSILCTAHNLTMLNYSAATEVDQEVSASGGQSLPNGAGKACYWDWVDCWQVLLKDGTCLMFLQKELTAASGRAAETHRGVLAGQDSETW